MEKLKEYDYNSDYYRLGSVIFYLIFKTYPYIIFMVVILYTFFEILARSKNYFFK
jgi:hypothetical protein